MPPHVAAYRAGRLAVRLLAEGRAKRLARRRRSYGPIVEGARLNSRLAASPLELSKASFDRLLPSVKLNATHSFDLLGSGWVELHPGMACKGIEGVRFDPGPSNASGHEAVNRSNMPDANRIYALIDDRNYRPIEWRIDFRSGYLWPADVHFHDLAIGRTRGADIKIPWELGRLQHLPRMALCAAALLPDDSAARLHREARNQILDFIAANPPQFGANWGCPMDVGIRAANLCLAVDIFERIGLAFDGGFHEVLCASLTDHGRHIAANLEWAAEGRSNHYLSDLAGLAFIGAYLPMSDETLGWLAYALAEVAKEATVQFFADGGNYEGSVGYHRLSAEIVAYTLALGLGLSDEIVAKLRTLPSGLSISDRGARIKEIGRRAAEVVRAPEPSLIARLRAMAHFMEATATPDGSLVQIGDMDSGRLFKLDAAPKPTGNDAACPIENELSVRSTAGAIAALLSETPLASSECEASAYVVRALSGGRTLGGTGLHEAKTGSAYSRAASGGHSLPSSERTYRIELPAGATAGMTLDEFPEFGLWVWRSPRLHLTFRCAAHRRADAPYGHTHDDNLGITLWADGRWIIEDPGTYVYTSFPELRNAYRAAKAHFVPRAREWAAVAFDATYLFACRHLASARMVRADVAGAEAELMHGDGDAVIRRTIAWQEGLLVVDRSWACHLDEAIPAEALPPGRGYGRRARHSHRFPSATSLSIKEECLG